jgi:hypothetical protein
MKVRNKNFITKIQRIITSDTYGYFCTLDSVFVDFVYGDPFYITLADICYSFLSQRDMDVPLDFECLGMIDTVELVSRLYEEFVKADQCYKKKYTGNTRHRKNYLHKALRHATPRLLQNQMDQNDCFAEIGPESGKMRYFSLDKGDGALMDLLSYRIWKKEHDQRQEYDHQIETLENMIWILPLEEREIVELCLLNFDVDRMIKLLKISKDSLYKKLYRIKTKLREFYLSRKGGENHGHTQKKEVA